MSVFGEKIKNEKINDLELFPGDLDRCRNFMLEREQCGVPF